jgi:hypothetical protein
MQGRQPCMAPRILSKIQCKDASMDRLHHGESRQKNHSSHLAMRFQDSTPLMCTSNVARFHQTCCIPYRMGGLARCRFLHHHLSWHIRPPYGEACSICLPRIQPCVTRSLQPTRILDMSLAFRKCSLLGKVLTLQGLSGTVLNILRRRVCYLECKISFRFWHYLQAQDHWRAHTESTGCKRRMQRKAPRRNSAQRGHCFRYTIRISACTPRTHCSRRCTDRSLAS